METAEGLKDYLGIPRKLSPSSEDADGGPVTAIDVGAYRVTKVRAMQCHASQKPPFPGNPEEEAGQLACHEYFGLARPRVGRRDATDIFAKK